MSVSAGSSVTQDEKAIDDEDHGGNDWDDANLLGNMKYPGTKRVKNQKRYRDHPAHDLVAQTSVCDRLAAASTGPHRLKSVPC
jgi:hypothetical protein